MNRALCLLGSIKAMAWVVAVATLAGAMAAISPTGTASALPPVAASVNAAAAQCAALARQDLAALHDAPTHVSAAQFAAATAQAPAYCDVRATITRTIGIAVQLPAQNWNGKLLELGCGSFCGSIELAACAEPLRRGYACVLSDMGHQAAGGDTRWADDNLPAQFDFANRGPHATLLAARAIVGQYYAQPPRRAYFMGCSTGGYLGMIEAQRFPWDFDGIVAGDHAEVAAGDPDMDEADLLMRTVWAWRALRDAGGKPLLTYSDLRLLHAAALVVCDLSDGVRDGIIGDPLGCPFRGEELLCRPGQQTGCLSAVQVAAVRKMYEGPSSAAGRRLSTRGPLPGSELAWLPDAPPAASPGPGELGYNLYVPSPGQHWLEGEFDFERDYQRLGLGALYNDTNPDLRRFRDAGAKLIVYQGGSDTVEMAAIYDYYDNVEKLMGGRAATQAFFRLYTVPGMGHCGGGEGADQIDYLGYLEAWVERGEAPDRMIGAHAGGAPGTPPAFTRPVFPYPQYARYAGTGDVNDARNFSAVTPASK
jgi:feruloyl esterase